MDRPIKILAVCHMGVGTSILIKMQVEKALKILGIIADVEVSDVLSAKFSAQNADIVVTSNELVHYLGEISTPIVGVSNFMDLDGIVDGLRAASDHRSGEA